MDDKDRLQQFKFFFIAFVVVLGTMFSFVQAVNALSMSLTGKTFIYGVTNEEITSTNEEITST